MGRIVVLDPLTVSKIAAGEVIERPASAVKELVENSIDAGAGRITVEVWGGGKSMIRVVDDGIGMAPEDARLAFERHATSKIARAEDLLSVASLGFRGEALASIAAVSRVEMTTRERGAEYGRRVIVEEGRIIKEEDVGCPPGTSIVVTRLFDHFPARKRFLKSDSTEAGHITEAVYRAALGRPDIAFSLMIDGKPVVFTQGTGLVEDVVAVLFGTDLARGLRRIEFERGNIAIHGLVGDPASARASRSLQYLFVNSRWVRSVALRAVVEEALGPIPGRRFPVFIIHLRLPPSMVDPNVHPGKMEVKFTEEYLVKTALHRAVRSLIESGRNSTGALRLEVREGLEPYSLESRNSFDKLPESFPAAHHEHASAQTMTGLPLDGSGPAAAEFKVLGQFKGCYILVEGQGGLYIIDQHAAHERVCYEELLEGEGPRRMQLFASPLPVDLSPTEFAAALESKGILESLGFLLESFGNNTVLVRGVPAALANGFSQEVFRSLLYDLDGSIRAHSENLREAAARALSACHSAVRGGQSLSPAEIEELIVRLQATKDPYHCPHGRPTIVEIPLGEIEKRFGRR